ncbi:hypothetical protein E2562_020888 [Oryza meyeriana var. granulata]|uniref:Uncharacterized protein n=1 Tax=Oryza meyeriana var. granulata TaxID=110450 RepID=A0A6G1D611_9ORYZ|nr:hypothetical protein E2562_020888 [Oryza meyeriana var. granulata]
MTCMGCLVLVLRLPSGHLPRRWNSFGALSLPSALGGLPLCWSAPDVPSSPLRGGSSPLCLHALSAPFDPPPRRLLFKPYIVVKGTDKGTP